MEESIKKYESDSSKMDEFIEAIEEYRMLIKDGLAKERGYNILTSEEIYMPVSNDIHCQSFV